MSRASILLGIGLSVVLATETGCGSHACNESWPADSLQIYILRDRQPGTYTVEFSVGGETHTCTVEATKETLATGAVGECSGGGGLELLRTNPPQDCVDNQCQDAYPREALLSLSFGAPDRLPLRILHDGQLERTLELKPNYRTSMPNGDGCEPTVRTATETIDLREPP